MIAFDQAPAIRRCLSQHPYLLDTLIEALAQVHEALGDVLLRMELHRDPSEGWEELFLVVRSPYSVEESIDRENDLMQRWFRTV